MRLILAQHFLSYTMNTCIHYHDQFLNFPLFYPIYCISKFTSLSNSKVHESSYKNLVVKPKTFVTLWSSDKNLILDHSQRHNNTKKMFKQHLRNKV